MTLKLRRDAAARLLSRVECGFLMGLKAGATLLQFGECVSCGESSNLHESTIDYMVGLGVIERKGDGLAVTDLGRSADLFRGTIPGKE